MDMLNALAAPSDGRDSDDALKVLVRVADAFDNPSLHEVDKELKLFVVNVVKSHHLSTSFPSRECVCQDTTHGSYDSSFDATYEGAELVELGDVSVWKHAASYPYASRRSPSHKQRSCSKKILHQENGMYDITKMLLTSSPLDRLDRLARMELKKTGWVERLDKWTIVEMGLQGAPLPMTPPRTPAKKGGIHARDSLERFSSAKTMSPNGQAQALPFPRRPKIGGRRSLVWKERGRDAPERNQWQADAIKTTPTLMRSPARYEDADSHLADVSTLSYGDASKLSRTNTTTPIRGSRLSRTFLNPQASRVQTGGRLGQAVRNIVKKVLPPSSVGGTTTVRGTGYPWIRQVGDAKGTLGGSPSVWTSQAEMTPRSDVSGESGWTSGSASSWVEARAQGCMDYQTTNRWSGFWH